MDDKKKRLNRAVFRIALLMVVGAVVFEAVSAGSFSFLRLGLMLVIGLFGLLLGRLIGQIAFLRD